MAFDPTPSIYGNLTFFSSSMAPPKKKLQGLVAATITPMTEHGEINFSVIGQYVDYLVEEQGVKNIFVNGTTGEGLSLSVSERRQVAEEWVAKGRNKLDQVVIHVGALSLKDSQELARHAAEIGADGIAVIAPFFLKPTNKVRAEELLDGIQDKIPTFQGLKFSDTDLLDFGQCVDQNRQQQFAFLFGVDEQLLSALVMGATGAVGSFVFRDLSTLCSNSTIVSAGLQIMYFICDICHPEQVISPFKSQAVINNIINSTLNKLNFHPTMFYLLYLASLRPSPHGLQFCIVGSASGHTQFHSAASLHTYSTKFELNVRPKPPWLSSHGLLLVTHLKLNLRR
ncbi:N-acetylneuraminate lyase isoform X3 [Halichoerus grypus]